MDFEEWLADMYSMDKCDAPIEQLEDLEEEYHQYLYFWEK